MKIHFDKQKFINDAQQNLYAPQFDKLKEGNLGEWLMFIMFVPTFGLLWYPMVAANCTCIKLKS